jgi:hypothetical protein
MAIGEEGVVAFDESDWYDTTPIETDEQERDRRVKAARERLDVGAGVRFTVNGDGYVKVAEVKQDVDRIGRVLRASTFGSGPGPAQVDPDDIAAALQLFAPVRKSLDVLESHVMGIARAQRLSWRVIAEPLGLQSPQAAAQRWERLTNAVAPRVWRLRQRAVDALQESKVMRGEAQVLIDGPENRTVIVEVLAPGASEVRREVADRVVGALRTAGLSISIAGKQPVADVAAYLADGGTVEVAEPRQPRQISTP